MGIEDPGEQIVVVDPLTLRFDLGTPRPNFNLEVASQYGFWIASPSAAIAHSTGPQDQRHDYLVANPVGTGPYAVESDQPGDRITFAQFPKYWRGWEGDHFKKVIMLAVPEPNTRRQLLERGEVDVIWPGTADDLADLADDPRFVVTNDPTFRVKYIALGAYGPLADPRARQAMNHAFDAASYIHGIERDTVDATHGVFPDLLVTADKSLTNLPFDLQKAKQLFDAAGVPEGTELTYEFITGFGREGELFQATLAEVGIRLKLVEKSFSAFIADYFSDAPPEQRANMYAFSWWPNYNHPFDWSWVLYHKDAWGSAGANVGFYDNAEVNRLIDSMYNAVIDEKLQRSSKRLQTILALEDPPWIPIAQIPSQITFRNDVTGWTLQPTYIRTLDFYPMVRSVTG